MHREPCDPWVPVWEWNIHTPHSLSLVLCAVVHAEHGRAGSQDWQQDMAWAPVLAGTGHPWCSHTCHWRSDSAIVISSVGYQLLGREQKKTVLVDDVWWWWIKKEVRHLDTHHKEWSLCCSCSHQHTSNRIGCNVYPCEHHYLSLTPHVLLGHWLFYSWNPLQATHLVLYTSVA